MQRVVIDWLLPPGFQRLVRAALGGANRSRRTGDFFSLLQSNRVLHERHKGQRCFVLATGPSIKFQNLGGIAGEISIAVSNFFVHPDFKQIRPKYYMIAPFHPPITEKAFLDWIAELDTATRDMDTTFLFAAADEKLIRESRALSGRDFFYLDYDPTLFENVPDRIDLTKPIMPPQSITVAALQLALAMAFSNVYLLGCDHDWILHLGESRHFYQENQHALARKGYDEWFGGDFDAYCMDYVRLWRQYRALEKTAKKQGTRIENATAGGLLDVYPRRSLESILNSSNDLQ